MNSVVRNPYFSEQDDLITLNDTTSPARAMSAAQLDLSSSSSYSSSSSFVEPTQKVEAPNYMYPAFAPPPPPVDVMPEYQYPVPPPMYAPQCYHDPFQAVPHADTPSFVTPRAPGNPKEAEFTPPLMNGPLIPPPLPRKEKREEKKEKREEKKKERKSKRHHGKEHSEDTKDKKHNHHHHHHHHPPKPEKKLPFKKTTDALNTAANSFTKFTIKVSSINRSFTHSVHKIIS